MRWTRQSVFFLWIVEAQLMSGKWEAHCSKSPGSCSSIFMGRINDKLDDWCTKPFFVFLMNPIRWRATAANFPAVMPGAYRHKLPRHQGEGWRVQWFQQWARPFSSGDLSLPIPLSFGMSMRFSIYTCIYIYISKRKNYCNTNLVSDSP